MTAKEAQANIIRAKLTNSETLLTLQNVNLVQDWLPTEMVLGLVQRESSYAVFLLNGADLKIETVLPIDSNFEFTPTSHDIDNSKVYMSISAKRVSGSAKKVMLEMAPSKQTNDFFESVINAKESGRNRRPEFEWLQKYDGGDSPLADLDSTDIRHNIAAGRPPIAARESVIQHQMSLLSHRYTNSINLKVFTGTWNVNGQPPSVRLSDWLACDAKPPDVYAIGFQELDLSKEAFLFNDTPREVEWSHFVTEGLHPGVAYKRVTLVRLVGMMLIVYVSRDLYDNVTDVWTECVGTGIMGKMGNKGGVGVSLMIHNTTICFVNSHLAAHVEEFERRNQDYHDICTRMNFSPARKRIRDHDLVFWLGDLNYRITELDSVTAKNHIEKGNFQPLLDCDQLNQQRKRGNVFHKYKEGELLFRPTYKYDTNSDTWDSSEKNRAPAWTDRVLWIGDEIRQIVYRSHPQLRISDHKPVSALFDTPVRKVEAEKYRKVHEEVMKQLDKLENEFLPQVMVDSTEIIFDTVRFLEPQTRELMIANTGQVPVSFEFIKKLNDPGLCKQWLTLQPFAGFITPGEKADIRLEVLVDKHSACKLNTGRDQIYDILVLHLDGGKDIFITVTGTYERSCFGCSMEALVHMREPIRELPAGRILELEKRPMGGLDDEPYAVPKEVWFLVDHLYRHGLKTPMLFLQPGLTSELAQIRSWLDTGSCDPMPGSVHSVAESLLLLLESTAEPLVPYPLYNRCLQATSFTTCKQVLADLPELRRNVFVYLCAFLQEVLAHKVDNNLDANVVASLFGSVFLRDPPTLQVTAGSQSQNDRKKMNFVYHFLVNDKSDFIPPR